MAENEGSEKGSDKGSASDRDDSIATTVKKLFTAGIGTAFLTEEAVRSYVNDLKLPKDVLKMLIQGAQKSKDEITSMVSREVVEMLEKVDWAQEVSSFFQKNKLRVALELEVEPRAGSVDEASPEDEIELAVESDESDEPEPS